MKDLNTRAVLTGSLVDLLGTFLAGALFFGFLGAATATTSAEELTRTFESSMALQLVSLGIGLAMTAAGAYVAARIAVGHERMHAFAVGIVSTLVGFSVVVSAPESSPFWSQAAGLILTVPASYLGGEVRRLTAGQGRSPT